MRLGLPVEKILKDLGEDYFVKHIDRVDYKDVEGCDKIIICGTSLKDNDYSFKFSRFDKLFFDSKPLFGICAGMQIIGKKASRRFAKDEMIEI